jgi:hypothetical protein
MILDRRCYEWMARYFAPHVAQTHHPADPSKRPGAHVVSGFKNGIALGVVQIIGSVLLKFGHIRRLEV